MGIYGNPVITLGSATVTSNFATASTTAVQVTGATSTVTIPSGGRTIKIEAFTGAQTNATNAALGTLSIWDGVVASGTQLAQANLLGANATASNEFGYVFAIVTPAAGSKTYNLGYLVSAGTGTLNCSSTNPLYFLVTAL